MIKAKEFKMKVFLSVVSFIFFFIACSGEKNAEQSAFTNPFTLEKNQGIFYFMQGKLGEKEQKLYLSIEQKTEGNLSVNASLLGEKELYFSGFLNDDNTSFVLHAQNAQEKDIIEGQISFDTLFIPTIEANVTRAKQQTPAHFILAQNKVNVLDFVENVAQEKKSVDGASFTSTLSDEGFLIPSNSKLSLEASARINQKIGLSAQSIKELQTKLMKVQQEKFAKEEKFSFYTEHINSLSPYYIDDEILVFSSLEYVYLGGAHGMPYLSSLIFSLQDGSEISGKSKDLFENVNDEALLNLVLEALSVYNETSSFKDTQGAKRFIEWDDTNKNGFVALPENFFITEKGVEFVYQPYEIASFAEGHISIYITFDKLAPFVKKSSPLAYLFKQKS
ncbi:hypothetical protein DMB95_08310 [Campylobacter sp. MIT 12-8780]|nr:hypothetical protein DMB95_08310 [Campylobacter sp. MIT 12-8780]